MIVYLIAHTFACLFYLTSFITSLNIPKVYECLFLSSLNNRLVYFVMSHHMKGRRQGVRKITFGRLFVLLKIKTKELNIACG